MLLSSAMEKPFGHLVHDGSRNKGHGRTISRKPDGFFLSKFQTGVNIFLYFNVFHCIFLYKVR